MYEYKGIKFEVFKMNSVFGVFVDDGDTSPLFQTKHDAIEYAKKVINKAAA